MRIGYVGNFGPAHSTENEYRKAWTGLGHDVIALQENDPASWKALLHQADVFDMVLWTRTWHLPDMPQHLALDACATAGVPTVAVHLDRWWGLDREHQIHDEPFFRCRWVFTADGGHDDLFAAAGVNHHWLPPAVSAVECEPGTPQRRFRSAVAFVGSWQGYHAEWAHRDQLVSWLRANYGAACWPRPGRPAIRGIPLRDLYASVGVLVGDSCLVPNPDGTPVERYWSDRVPETLGRGGFLLHPTVPGLAEQYPMLPTWQAGDWDALRSLLDYWLDRPDDRAAVAAAARQHVLAAHTYTHRAATILATVFG